MTDVGTEAAPPSAPDADGDAGPTGPRLSAFSVFRKRDFRLLWSAQLVSTIGTALTDLAAGILVFRLTGSALSVGLMFVATAVPTLIVGLIAGVFVDRYDRRKIMVIADLLRAAIVVSIPILITINIALLYLAVALVSTISQFFNPANDAVLPEVASDEELAAANSWIMISSFGSTSIGFALSGLLATAFDINWAFRLDALTFLFSAALIVFIRVGKIEAEGNTSVGVVVANLKEGVSTLVHTPVLRSLFISGAPVFLSFGLWNVLLLPFALKALQATEFEYGLQEAVTSVGFVVGSLMMARFADRFREGSWIVVATVAMGVGGVLYGFASSIAVALVLVTLTGFFNAPASIARRVILQRNTPRELRGRVFSAYAVARDVLFLIGISLAGLADVIDIRFLVVVSSIVLIGAGLLAGILPGIGQPAAEWRRAMSALRGGTATPAVPVTIRAATLADFDRLAGRLPALARLDAEQRRALVTAASVRDIPAGATIVGVGEVGDAAYFILHGRAAAGTPEADGSYRSLSTMEAGDFFGEIAALTGSLRTATVVAEEPTTVVEVPSAALRVLMTVPELGSLFLSKLTERLSRTNTADLPRFSGVDQASLKDLRTPRPTAEELPKSY
ncbi:MAG: transporter, family, macrolide efflux protein [Chloroflexota bacterium]|nr:transporter, family, macrolide efflux protein [Chloroflexota bacterium]